MIRKRKQDELTYETALQQLETLLQNLETEEVAIDTLAEKMKEAGNLLSFCRQKLRSTETEVKAVLESFKQ